MTIADHPRFARLLIDVRNAKEICAWRGTVFRCVELRWARPNYLVTGEGTRRHGSRWMRPAVTEVVHAASTESLALKESRRNLSYYAIGKPLPAPRASVGMELHLRKVLDLRQPERAMPTLILEELLSEDWRKLNAGGRESLGQAVGRAAWEAGLEGLLVPSAVDRRSRNLIWFPGSLGTGSGCVVSGRTELEQWLVDPHADLQEES